MGTRGVIARPADRSEAAFNGRYHHWDSYPDGLGATLFELWNGHFHRDTEAMLKTLVDEHPAGWSTINGADFTQAPGFEEAGFSSGGPKCYCHGGRAEEGGEPLTEKDASSAGAEWVYVLDGNVMHVLSSRKANGQKMIGMFGVGDPKARWVGVARVELDKPAPDWGAISARG